MKSSPCLLHYFPQAPAPFDRYFDRNFDRSFESSFDRSFDCKFYPIDRFGPYIIHIREGQLLAVCVIFDDNIPIEVFGIQEGGGKETLKNECCRL